MLSLSTFSVTMFCTWLLAAMYPVDSSASPFKTSSLMSMQKLLHLSSVKILVTWALNTFTVFLRGRVFADIVTDDMDKKLLLSIQSECNNQGICIPWQEIGQTMGDKISGGAVIQHLAKLRGRMVDQGLSVPPPLKRGGSSRISTGPSLNKKTPPKKPNASQNATPKSTKGLSKAMASTNMASDESEEGDWDSASEAEFSTPRTKRSKEKSKRRIRVKEESSGGEVETPTKVGDKRKRMVSLGGSPQKKVNLKGTNLEGTPTKSTRTKRNVDYRKMDGDSSDDGDSDLTNVTMDEEEGDKESYVAKGAPFLALEDDVPSRRQVIGRKTTAKPSSSMVTLRYGKSGNVLSFLKAAGVITEDDAAGAIEKTEDLEKGMSDAGSDSDSYRTDEIVGGETLVDGRGEAIAVGDVHDTLVQGNLCHQAQPVADLDEADSGDVDNDFVAAHSAREYGSFVNPGFMGSLGEHGCGALGDDVFNNQSSFVGGGQNNETIFNYRQFTNPNFVQSNNFSSFAPRARHPNALSLQTAIAATTGGVPSANTSSHTTVNQTPTEPSADGVHRMWDSDFMDDFLSHDMFNNDGFEGAFEEYGPFEGQL